MCTEWYITFMTITRRFTVRSIAEIIVWCYLWTTTIFLQFFILPVANQQEAYLHMPDHPCVYYSALLDFWWLQWPKNLVITSTTHSRIATTSSPKERKGSLILTRILLCSRTFRSRIDCFLTNLAVDGNLQAPKAHTEETWLLLNAVNFTCLHAAE